MKNIISIIRAIESCTNFETDKRMNLLKEGLKYIPFKLFFESAFNPNIKFFLEKLPEPFGFDEFKINDACEKTIDEAMQYIHLFLVRPKDVLDVPRKVDILYNKIFKYLSPSEGKMFVEMFEKRFKIKGIKQELINEFYNLDKKSEEGVIGGDVIPEEEKDKENKSESISETETENKKTGKKKS